MITVMCASHNGGERLRRTLDAMTRVREPAGGWRLTAVDNASSDDTHAIMQSFATSLPITVLQEPNAGKNRALNSAIEVALKCEGDVFVFCDDDVIAAEDWLIEMRAAADQHPAYDLFAGLTLPLWPHEPPQWLKDHPHYVSLFGVHDDPAEGPCDPRAIYGTNMAVRAKLFRDGARFNTDIGPNGTPTYAMGSETDFSLRMTSAGHKSWFAKRAAVQHIIREEQMTREWTLQRAYRFGRGVGRMGETSLAPLSPEQLARKNTVKSVVYPMLLPFLAANDVERRRWQWAFDQGYEDGTRERAGGARRWRRD